MIGRSPDRLTITEQRALAGKWIAVQIYTPRTTPERRIVVIGSSALSCIQQLRDRGLDPSQYEIEAVKAAF